MVTFMSEYIFWMRGYGRGRVPNKSHGRVFKNTTWAPLFTDVVSGDRDLYCLLLIGDVPRIGKEIEKNYPSIVSAPGSDACVPNAGSTRPHLCWSFRCSRPIGMSSNSSCPCRTPCTRRFCSWPPRWADCIRPFAYAPTHYYTHLFCTTNTNFSKGMLRLVKLKKKILVMRFCVLLMFCRIFWLITCELFCNLWWL